VLRRDHEPHVEAAPREQVRVPPDERRALDLPGLHDDGGPAGVVGLSLGALAAAVAITAPDAPEFAALVAPPADVAAVLRARPRGRARLTAAYSGVVRLLGCRTSVPRTMYTTISARFVAWSPKRSRYFAANMSEVARRMLRESSIIIARRSLKSFR
jgi:hypothetical protein